MIARVFYLALIALALTVIAVSTAQLSDELQTVSFVQTINSNH